MKPVFISLCMIMSCMMYGQQNEILCKGVIKDKNTQRVLENVRVYYRDTVPVYSNSQGQFQLTAKKGEKLQFRKSGYAWQTKEITAEDMQNVYLVNSGDDSGFGDFNSKDSTEVFCDGMLIPFEEWKDLGSMLSKSKENIVNLTILKGEFKKQGNETIIIRKNKIDIQSSFNWNRK